jgi:hypothetical protein
MEHTQIVWIESLNLPPEEALAVVREIVHIALDQPDLGTSAGSHNRLLIGDLPRAEAS